MIYRYDANNRISEENNRIHAYVIDKNSQSNHSLIINLNYFNFDRNSFKIKYKYFASMHYPGIFKKYIYTSQCDDDILNIYWRTYGVYV